MDASKSSRRRLLLVPVLIVSLIAVASAMRSGPEVKQEVAPTVTKPPPGVDSAQQSPTRESSLEEVLQIANDALVTLQETLVDYKAHFVKQERTSGTLSEKTEMDVKIQARLRNETNDAPMRAYLKFQAPEATKGREVLWGEDLYDGKMAVHECTMLLSWKTVWLDPTGMLAMAGQRYPISEIGITGLVEKLIERGAKDRNNPDVTVTITRDHEFDGRNCLLMQAKRAKPSGDEEDFSLAEIVFDSERSMILSYQSFGWPEKDSPQGELPLLESYQYLGVEMNVGLTEEDFDVTNKAYAFP